MARISNTETYPNQSPIEGADYLIGTGVDLLTKTFTLLDISTYAGTGLKTLAPLTITAAPNASSVFSADNNLIYITWVGGNGDYTLTIPSAASIPYRTFRVVNDSTLSANTRVQVTAVAGESIDGSASYELRKSYGGVSLWSDGTNWIVIQAKS